MLAATILILAGSFTIGEAVALNLNSPLLTWPGKTLRVYDGSAWSKSVVKGVHGMNQIGMNMKVVIVHNKNHADVVISDTKKFSDDCAASGVVGCAHMGYQPGKQGWIKVIPPGNQEFDSGQYAQIIMHELGHVLGLRHRKDKQCHLMSPEICGGNSQLIAEAGCPVNDRFGIDPQEWCPGVLHSTKMCAPTNDDATALVHLYGGSLPKNYSAWCHQKKIQMWLADCVYPGWHSHHNPYPLPLTAKNKACSSATPRWGWEPLAWAQKAARKAWHRHPDQAILTEIRRLDQLARLCPQDLCLPPFAGN